MLINYEKYTKNWSPRGTVVLLVADTLATGFFLGLALTAGIYTHKTWNWALPLVLSFGSGVGALQATLILLHYCSSYQSAKSRGCFHLT